MQAGIRPGSPVPGLATNHPGKPEASGSWRPQ